MQKMYIGERGREGECWRLIDNHMLSEDCSIGEFQLH